MRSFEWTVVGAGPAGIAAVGKLIDGGVKPSNIAWIDPAFKVGDLGDKWRRVSSNTKVGLFLKYLTECKSFRFSSAPEFNLKHLDTDSTCLLQEIAKPLEWVTDHLKEGVHPILSNVKGLKMTQQMWEVGLEKEKVYSKNVILAIGAEPKKLNFPHLKEIPLTTALDDEKLLNENLGNDTVAVFGSSHSSMIVLRNLLKTNVKKVINFYTSPLKFAVYLDDWILFDNTGLKGESAVWARNHIHGKWPDRLERYHSRDENFKLLLQQCSKVVYTIGFQTRATPETPQFEELIYNERNGIIAPGLFGLGIAFPQKVEDRFGNEECSVGLWKFMKYLRGVLPLWMKYAP